jgi:hypothetical protein
MWRHPVDYVGDVRPGEGEVLEGPGQEVHGVGAAAVDEH